MNGLLPASLPMMKVTADITALLLTKSLPRIEILLRIEVLLRRDPPEDRDLPGDIDPLEYRDLTEDRCPTKDRGSSEDRDPTEEVLHQLLVLPKMVLKCKYNMFYR